MAGMKKAARGLARTVTSQVTNDPDDKTGESIDDQELASHYKKRVTQADIWECPIESLSPLFQTIGVVHQGIIVTMEDGKMYMVHKLASAKNASVGEAVVAYASKKGIQWAWVKTKKVKSAKLEDYVDACGDKYDFYADNCQHAVKRMWALE